MKELMNKLYKPLLIVSPMVIMFLLLLSITHHSKAFADGKIIVSVPALNVRQGAGLTNPVIGLVHQGEIFTVINKQNKWDKIELSNNQVGWVANWLVNDYIVKNEQATVTVPVLNIRDQGHLNANIIGELKQGDTVSVQGKVGNWSQINLPSQGQGWIASQYTTPKVSENQSNQATTTASTPQKISSQSSLKNNQNNNYFGVTSHFVNMFKQYIAKKLNSSNSSDPNNTSLVGKTIVIDPGHGGIDDGTTSLNGVDEKQLTLETAQAVAAKLKQSGAHVILTRNSDTFISLQKRVDISDANHADAFISFHYNFSPDHSISGLTDFYYNKAKDEPLASTLLQAIDNKTGLVDRGTRFDDLHVLRTNAEPCTLIELGFLSNPQEQQVVESSAFREKVADAVDVGLENYFKSK